MLPTNIINSYKKLVQTVCLPAIKQGQRRQFVFGLNALSLRPFVSLNSNARTTFFSRSAAESKMARLLHNTRLQQQMAKLHLMLSGVQPTSLVNVDHSEFNGLSVLLFGMQTRDGRAIPVYLETMPSLAQGHKSNSKKYLEAKARYNAWKEKTRLDQYGYTIHCISKLTDELGFTPRLVFDRGFCNKRILKSLKRSEVTYYIRARAWFSVIDEEGRKKRIAEFEPGSHIVQFGCKLRLVVGSKLGEHNEPWYIFTTDLKTGVSDIIKIYYYRFEVEELFRDMKSLLKTGGSRLKKPVHLATLLWFVCLGIVILYLSRPKLYAHEKIQSYVHTKKKLSIFRTLLENFERELRTTVYLRSSEGFG